MAKSLICDNCERKAVEDYALGWFIIEEVGMSSRMMGQDALVGKTYCGENCMYEHLHHRIEERTKDMK